MFNKKVGKVGTFLFASLLILSIGFTSCKPSAGGDPDDTYTGKISDLSFTIGNDNITFIWTNPTDENFCGVKVYKDETLIETLEKNKNSLVVSFEESDTATHVFTFKACITNSSGVEIESVNSVTKSITRSKLKSVSNIGCGYDAINGEYFCAGKSVKGQILQFADDFTFEKKAINNSNITYYAGKTFNSYRESFAQSIGITGGYAGFSGSFDASVGFDKSYSEEVSFGSATSVNIKAQEYLTDSQKNIDVLKEHLTKDFKDCINAPAGTFSTDTLFKKYGTHVLLDTYIGGRFVVNYAYTNITGEQSTSIKTAIEANYTGVIQAGAKSGTEFNNNSQMSSSNTKITGYTRGGNGAAFSDMDGAIQSMKDWTASLSEEKTWSLIDAPDTILDQDTCTGIWLLADDSARQKEIHDAYLALLEKNTESIAAVQTSKWIKKIYIYCCDKNDAKSLKDMKTTLTGKLPNIQYQFIGENTAEMENITSSNTGDTLNDKQTEYIREFDLMRGAGSNYAFLLVEYTTNKDEALRGVFGNSSKKMENTEKINYRYDANGVCKYSYNEDDWKLVYPIGEENKSEPDADYCYGKDKSRVLFQSWKQTRNGKTGAEAFPIKEIAVYNDTSKKTSESPLIQRWTLSPESNFNDIGEDTGGDYIYLRIYYDSDDLK